MFGESGEKMTGVTQGQQEKNRVVVQFSVTVTMENAGQTLDA